MSSHSIHVLTLTPVCCVRVLVPLVQPKYETLGEEFAGDSNIVIAKVDATENDTPAKVEGFPTLIFYPAGDKKNPITFEGDRSVEAMAAFIKEKRKSAPGGPKDNAADHQHEEL
jgi:protein disulfide-isomerase A1